MLQEGVVSAPEDIDLCMILGAGWPFQMGGVTPFLDRVGASERVFGDTFHHPDDAAVARTVLTAPRGATLWFNYRNRRTERWADPGLCAAHHYEVRFPEDETSGAVLELATRRQSRKR